MAKTITLTSTSYEGRYMELYCEQVSNGSSANSSTIKWTLSTKGGGSTWYSTGPTKVVINGTTVYTKDRVEWYGTGSPSNPVGTFPACAGSVSGSVTVPHNNDGTKSISVSFSTAIFVGSGSAKSYSSNWALDSIPRYANITSFTVDKRNETSVYCRWTADATCDYAWYSKDNGATFTALPSDNIITGLSPNTKYNFKLRIRRKDSQLTTTSGTYSQTTYDYPYCNASSSFIIGDHTGLNFYNPLSRTIKVEVICDDGTVYGVDTITGTYIGGFNNEGWQNNWYKTIPNKTSGKYQVKVTYGSSVKTRNNGNTYSIRGTETPTFSNFTYKDINADVVNITGNDQVLVKGFSNLSVTIPSSDKMVAIKGANPKNYVASIDYLSKTVDYSSGDVTTTLGVVNSGGNIRLHVRAYDSRNLSALAYKDITIYDYEKPVINVDVSRLNNFEDQTTLKVSGTYSRLTIDESDKNTITDLQYRYKEVGGEWNNWTKLNTTITSGKFTCNDVVLSLDNTKAFEFEVQATDKLSHNELSVPLDVGEAIFFISSNKKACYINGELVKGSTVVSDTEPTDGEKIWLQKRKNLFDVNNANILDNTYVDTTQNTILHDDTDLKLFYVPIIGGKKYSIRKVQTTRFRLGTTETIPKDGVPLIDKAQNDTTTQIILQTSSKANYLSVYYYRGASDTLSEETILKSISIEEYGNNKIYTKNDNDVYEEFNLPTHTILHNEEKLDAFLTNPSFDDVQCKNLLYTPYNENNKLTRTATRNDHYWETNYYAYLEKGVTYTFSCEIDDPSSTEVFFLKDKAYTNYFAFGNATRFTFVPSVSGVYFIRLDVNTSGATRKFWNFQIEKGSVATSYVEAKSLNGRANYTYAEQRIGTWVNGKPLYRKIYSIDKFPNNTTLEVASDLENVKVKNIYGYCENSTQMFPLNNGNPGSTTYQIQLWYVYSGGGSETDRIFIQSGTDRSSYSGIVILEYTKTTD